MPRFRYNLICTGCGVEQRGEVVTATVVEPTSLQLECVNCGPLLLTIRRRYPTDATVRDRQTSKPRTPIHGTPLPPG